MSEDNVTIADVIITDQSAYAVEVREESIVVDVSEVGVAGPPGPVGPAGPVGPVGPAGPTTFSGAGFPADSVGGVGAMYEDTTAHILYGPKLATATAGPTNQTLIGNFWYQTVIHNASNAAPFEVGIEFQVTADAIDLTAVRFYREFHDVQATTQVTVWNATTQAQIHRTTVAVPLGAGWRVAPLSAAVRLTAGNYVVSYSLIDAGAYSAHIKDASEAIPPSHNVKYVRSRYALSAGVFPNATTSTYPSMVDAVFTPITSWPRAEIQTLTSSGPPMETLGYVGDTYIDAKAGVQYGPKLSAVVAQQPSQNLFGTGYYPAGTINNQPASEWGMQFDVNCGGLINGVKYFRPTQDVSTTRTVRLWSMAGAKLAEATSTNESGYGWRFIPFATPYRVTAGSYIVSYDQPVANMYVSWIAGVTAPAPTRNLSWGYGRNGAPNGTFPSVTQPNWWGVDVDFTAELLWPTVGSKMPKVDIFYGGFTPHPGASQLETWTWTKPAGAKLIHVTLQGSGAGGGSGRRGAAGTVRCGGGGGGGGQRKDVLLPAQTVAETCIVAIYTATGGAPGVTTDNTDGISANPSSACEFRFRGLPTGFQPGAYVYGGSNGYGGTATSGAGAGGALGASGGGAAATNGTTGANSPTTYIEGSAFGGGGGGGLTAANAFGNGGSAYRGQLSSEYGVTNGGTTDGAAGANPGIVDFPEVYPWAHGGGGGGGAGSVAGPGGRGSNGYRGGGGGGGGASVNGQTSGAGGDGGRGYIMVVTYF